MRLLVLLVAALALAGCAGGNDATPSLEPDSTTPGLTKPPDLRALELKVDYLVRQASVSNDRMDQAFLTPDELRGIIFPIPSDYRPITGDDLLLAWLNGASHDGLTALPGVGDSLADRIVLARPFTNLDQIADVAGVGEADLAAMKSLINQ